MELETKGTLREPERCRKSSLIIEPKTFRQSRCDSNRSHPYSTARPLSALGCLSPKEVLLKSPAPALETLAVSTPPLNTQT